MLIFGCARSPALHGLSLAAVSRGCCWPWCAASHHGGLACCRAGTRGHANFSSCGAGLKLPCSVWDPARPGVEPVSPCMGGQTPHHWTTRKVLCFIFLKVERKKELTQESVWQSSFQNPVHRSSLGLPVRLVPPCRVAFLPASQPQPPVCSLQENLQIDSSVLFDFRGQS